MMRGIGLQKVLMIVVVVFCLGLVIYPLLFLGQVAFNTGDPQVRPPEEYGLDNFGGFFQERPEIFINTLVVAGSATLMAIVIGFAMAWILSRTNVPGREPLERLMGLPYYVTPLVGALAWSALASPRSGFLNQIWYLTGAETPLFNINSAFGIAWVMALFEGTVAFVMISAAMKSMDPSLEESSQVLGAGKLETMARVTLPLVAPAVLGAVFFVFAEMLGAFAAAAVLGLPARFYVVTTAIWRLIIGFPPNYPLAAAMGLSLFVVMIVMMYLYGRIIRSGNYVTITGKAFRPRVMNMGKLTWVLLSVCILYLFIAVILPLLTLLYVSFLRFATVFPSEIQWTVNNYSEALTLAPVRSALSNSFILAIGTATIGVLFMGLLSWIIYRSRVQGSGLLEYAVMLPQAVPRLVFALGLLWAWLVIPIPIYGTLWLLLLAYLTVFLPLGVRTISGVMLQLDKSVEECARVCGASWVHQLRTVTMPLLRPGLIAAWMLLFIASVREIGTSVLLVSPDSKVIGPAIIATWESSGMQLTAAMALIQAALVFAALILLLRGASHATRIEGE